MEHPESTKFPEAGYPKCMERDIYLIKRQGMKVPKSFIPKIVKTDAYSLTMYRE
jgi:hypothetical protein